MQSQIKFHLTDTTILYIVYVCMCFCARVCVFFFFERQRKAEVMAPGFMFRYVRTYNAIFCVRRLPFSSWISVGENEAMVFTVWPILCIQISPPSTRRLFYATKIQAWIWIFNQNYFYYYLLITVCWKCGEVRNTHTHTQVCAYEKSTMWHRPRCCLSKLLHLNLNVFNQCVD